MSQTRNCSKFFQTNDIGLATTLSLFIPIERINKDNPRKAGFLFLNNLETEKLINKYWKGALRIEPKTYFGQLRLIKTRLYQQ